MVEERTVSPDDAVEPKKSSTARFCCIACAILFILIAGGILVMFLFIEKSCDTGFKLPEIFRPSPTAPVPPGGLFPEDFSDLPEYKVTGQYRDTMTVGVNPDVEKDDLEKLNRYLAQTHFGGMSVFNISYFNKADATELIAVYNYNSITGTNNFTILPPEPGARFPASQ